jgi:hypothetical protein
MDETVNSSAKKKLVKMLYFMGRFSWFFVVLIPILTCLRTTHAVVVKSLGRINVQATIEGVYDSNIFSSSSEEGDFLVRFLPLANYSKRLGPIIVDGGVGGNFGRYFNNSSEDFSDPVTNFSIRMAEDFGLFSVDKRTAGKIQFGFDTDISQRTETNEQLQDLISYTLYSANFSLRYNHSPKFGVSGDFNYAFRDYQDLKWYSPPTKKDFPYSNIETYTFGASAYYIYSPKLDLFFRYQYQINESPGTESSFISNHLNNFSIGADGQLTPKLDGNISFGYGVLDYGSTEVDSQDSILFHAGLNWAWREKTKVGLMMDKSFSPSPQDQGMLSTTFSAQISQRFTKRVAGTLAANYGFVDFSSFQEFSNLNNKSNIKKLRRDRTDTRYGVSLNILSNFTSYLNGRFSYAYSTTDSGYGDEFSNDRHLASISLIVQY